MMRLEFFAAVGLINKTEGIIARSIGGGRRSRGILVIAQDFDFGVFAAGGANDQNFACNRGKNICSVVVIVPTIARTCGNS